MWQPPLPNNDKVKVTIIVQGEPTVYFLYHYHTLNIAPFVERDDNKYYLTYMYVNDEDIICAPKLYLDKYINKVELVYDKFRTDKIGYVIESLKDVSFTNYLPQIGGVFSDYSFPRASFYNGIKFGQETSNRYGYAFPVDLDKEDFEVWRNGIKFTLHLNRDNKVDKYGKVVSYFDIIKAEFYGKLLKLKMIDDYVELKPKGE